MIPSYTRAKLVFAFLLLLFIKDLYIFIIQEFPTPNVVQNRKKMVTQSNDTFSDFMY